MSHLHFSCSGSTAYGWARHCKRLVINDPNWRLRPLRSIVTPFLAITNYQGSMLFTPISDSLDPQIQRLNEDNSRPRSRRKRRSAQKISPPKLSFYVSLNKQFSESDCLFPRVTPISLATDAVLVWATKPL